MMNRHHFLAFVLLVGFVLTGVACGDDTEDTISGISGECLVTAMEIGTLKQTIHTTASDGCDSTYTINVTGYYYPMYIDHEKGLIYNGDSLPKGTDVSKVTFSSFNTVGSAAIKSLTTGTDTLFTKSDSTDFRSPRLLTVYATDGVTRRTYEVRVNVHQQDGEEFNWEKLASTNTTLAALSEVRTLAVEETLYVFGANGTERVVMTTPLATPQDWTTTDIEGAEELNIGSVQHMGGMFYALDKNGKPAISADGINWTLLGGDFTADALVAAATKMLVAVKDGALFSSADGKNWTEDALDTEGEVPGAAFAAVCIPSRTDKTFEDLLLIGAKNGEPAVWKRNIDITGKELFPWMYLNISEENIYPCPVPVMPSLLRYDGASLLVDKDQTDGNVVIYQSLDNGRTWKTGVYDAPEDMTTPGNVAATVDKNNHIWLICTASGEIWRGRLNRLGWQNPPYVFTKTRKR